MGEPYQRTVFDHHRELDKYVYHYTSADVARNFILTNTTLKLGSYLLTNDPREVSDWQVFGWEEDESTSSLDRLAVRVRENVKRKAVVACFCRDRNPTGDLMEEVDRGYARARMWAQYSDKHQGVCLAFDVSKLDRAIRQACQDAMFVTGGPVNYIDRFPTNRLNGPFGFDLRGQSAGDAEHYFLHCAKERHKELFFEKSTDWSGENEYRWLVLCQSKVDAKYIEYGDALAGIMVGTYCRPADTEQLVDMAHGLKVPIARLSWVNGAPLRDYAFESSFWQREVQRNRT